MAGDRYSDADLDALISTTAPKPVPKPAAPTGKYSDADLDSIIASTTADPTATASAPRSSGSMWDRLLNFEPDVGDAPAAAVSALNAASLGQLPRTLAVQDAAHALQGKMHERLGDEPEGFLDRAKYGLSAVKDLYGNLGDYAHVAKDAYDRGVKQYDAGLAQQTEEHPKSAFAGAMGAGLIQKPINATAGAVVGGIPGVLNGDPVGALVGAGLGAAGMKAPVLTGVGSAAAGVALDDPQLFMSGATGAGFGLAGKIANARNGMAERIQGLADTAKETALAEPRAELETAREAATNQTAKQMMAARKVEMDAQAAAAKVRKAAADSEAERANLGESKNNRYQRELARMAQALVRKKTAEAAQAAKAAKIAQAAAPATGDGAAAAGPERTKIDPVMSALAALADEEDALQARVAAKRAAEFGAVGGRLKAYRELVGEDLPPELHALQDKIVNAFKNRTPEVLGRDPDEAAAAFEAQERAKLAAKRKALEAKMGEGGPAKGAFNRSPPNAPTPAPPSAPIPPAAPPVAAPAEDTGPNAAVLRFPVRPPVSEDTVPELRMLPGLASGELRTVPDFRLGIQRPGEGTVRLPTPSDEEVTVPDLKIRSRGPTLPPDEDVTVPDLRLRAPMRGPDDVTVRVPAASEPTARLDIGDEPTVQLYPTPLGEIQHLENGPPPPPPDARRPSGENTRADRVRPPPRGVTAVLPAPGAPPAPPPHPVPAEEAMALARRLGLDPGDTGKFDPRAVLPLAPERSGVINARNSEHEILRAKAELAAQKAAAARDALATRGKAWNHVDTLEGALADPDAYVAAKGRKAVVGNAATGAGLGLIHGPGTAAVGAFGGVLKAAVTDPAARSYVFGKVAQALRTNPGLMARAGAALMPAMAKQDAATVVQFIERDPQLAAALGLGTGG